MEAKEDEMVRKGFKVGVARREISYHFVGGLDDLRNSKDSQE